YLRSAGLFRGLEREFVFHPDASKQVLALNNFLNGIDRWHMGHVTYDGYPYGLNQVDEWIMRPLLAVKHALVRMTNPGIDQFNVPSNRQLFYWARILRVFYGMCVFGLCLATARYFTRSRVAFLTVGLLMALSPLMTVVTHSAAGDIGVDLFSMGTLLALCRYHDRPRLVWIAIAGLCCGLGFACKFHGDLAAFMIAAYLLLAMPTYSWRNVGRTAALGFMSLLFFIGGVFLGSPTLRETPKSTWSDMRDNMVYVKNDAATPEVLEKSVIEKIAYGLGHNGAAVCQALGWGIVLLSLVALGVCLWRWWRSTRSARPELSQRSKSSLHIAALGFVLFAGLLSTALKPTIQPFHYSYLVPILCLASGLVLDMLWQNRRRSVRLIGLAVLLCTVGDLAARSWREDYFWRRDDARGDARVYARDTFVMPVKYRGVHKPEEELKRYELHDLGLPVFRNRPSVILHPEAAFLKSVRILPVPTVPFPQTSRWIYMDGPVMPRNDRMFEVAGGHTVKKDVVFYETPQPMTFGIRVGDTPSTVRISAGGVTQEVHVTPHRQTVFTIHPKRWVKSSSNGLEVNIVAVEAH
ncbi:MAG: glycosyltransferase family 39 protein, partial [Kiritimatiellae bacterium]|nr:glycosyltransferase family 39 protein [Kiritimatiellia bacterium]